MEGVCLLAAIARFWRGVFGRSGIGWGGVYMVSGISVDCDMI